MGTRFEKAMATVEKEFHNEYIRGFEDGYALLKTKLAVNGMDEVVGSVEEPAEDFTSIEDFLLTQNQVSDILTDSKSGKRKRKGGFTSKKHKWSEEMLNVLENYARLKYPFDQVVQEMHESYGFTRYAILSKLHKHQCGVNRTTGKIYSKDV